jgi:hypothetical protein
MTKLINASVDPAGIANWRSDGHQRRRRYRYLISASHRMTWFLGKQFPRMFPLVFVLGYPKSGTSWACQLIADSLHLPFPQHAVLPIGFPAVVHGHERLTTKYPRAVYVLRDGRDALVSLFFHLLAERCKAVLPGSDSRAGDLVRREFTEFVDRQLRRPTATRVNWAQHARSYFACDHPHAALIKYEDLLTDAAGTLAAAIRRLTGEPIDPVRVSRAIDKFSFRSQSGRATGQEDRSSYLRKGQAGDWVNYFTPQAAERFAEACGAMLIAGGYEVDDSWVAKVSRRAAA